MFSKGLIIFYILAVLSRAEDNIEYKNKNRQESLKLILGGIQTSTNAVQNDNSLSHIEALLSIQLAHLERLTNMTEAALVQSGKIMNDFMIFASAMEKFAPNVNSCKKKQEPETPYQEQRDIDFTHYFWPKRIVESIMGSRNEGSIQSMHPYRNNENRKVTISTPCAALVWRIRRLSMEESNDCIADYLVINYGQYTSGKLCGTSANIYEDWTFHFGSSFDITFYSDCSENGYGFFIEWQCSETEPAHPIDVDDDDALSYDE
ncbi:unnamed protein product [Oikopleura dioica]|uniref:CUB domain-containing protein n=1 Tax=Oikopleura dioica TaxID=34765 RepID=E4WSG1_OIKDI|nr:unnamed protein product [Oikopleura dioica]